MKSTPALLSPLLRSDTQGVILSILAQDPDSELSISRLARASGTSAPTVMREVDRLLGTGLLTERRDGRNRLVRFDSTHPIARPLREILLYGYGPLAVLPRLLETLPGRLDAAYLYGSWADRYLGNPGSEPKDVDVLLIGDVDPVDAHSLATTASHMVGREVNMTVIDDARWSRNDDGFVQTVKARPLVPIHWTTDA